MTAIRKLISVWMLVLLGSLFLPSVSIAALTGTTYDQASTTTTTPATKAERTSIAETSWLGSGDLQSITNSRAWAPFFMSRSLLVVTRGAANLPFRSGDVILREFQTSRGIFDVAAETQVVGRTLHLKDIAVFPRGADALSLGTREVAALRNQLAAEARSLGFEQLSITGTRVSGANSGKTVDIAIDLTK